jgi:hypothetical protein
MVCACVWVCFHCFDYYELVKHPFGFIGDLLSFLNCSFMSFVKFEIFSLFICLAFVSMYVCMCVYIYTYIYECNMYYVIYIFYIHSRTIKAWRLDIVVIPQVLQVLLVFFILIVSPLMFGNYYLSVITFMYSSLFILLLSPEENFFFFFFQQLCFSAHLGLLYILYFFLEYFYFSMTVKNSHDSS